MDKVIGYVFGYGSLVNPEDLLVKSLVPEESSAIVGKISGFRRNWQAAMGNFHHTSNHKHYLDAHGQRLDICVLN